MIRNSPRMRQVGMRNWKLNSSAIAQPDLKISNLSNSNNTVFIDCLRPGKVYTERKTPLAPWQSYFVYMFWLKFKHINEQETRGSRSSRETWQYNTAEAHTQTHLSHTPLTHTQTRTTASCFVAFRIKLPTFFVVCRFSFIFSCASFPLLSSIPLLALLLPLNVVCISVCVWNSFIIKVSCFLFRYLSLSFARCCCMFHFETRFHFKLRELSTSLWSLLDFNLISHTRTHTYVSHIYMFAGCLQHVKAITINI